MNFSSKAIAGANKDFPAEVERQQGYLARIVNLAKQRYPNLRIAYLSGRPYAACATTGLKPEPHAYESAFAVRRLIEQQGRGDVNLNYDPAEGNVTAPLLLWGLISGVMA